MRVLVHDFSGHPFQVQLSRALAARGHDVLHLHCASFLTPKGGLAARPEDPATFQVEGLTLTEPIDKASLARRWWLERRYGHVLVPRVARFAPDVVLSANTHLDPQWTLQTHCRRHGIRFVYWAQDIISEAARRILTRRLPALGRGVAWYYTRKEAALLSRSDHVVAITHDFDPFLTRAGVPQARRTVIPNWAPTGEVRPGPRDNPWRARFGLGDRFVFLYSGTLGLKHNPGMLFALARHFRDAKEVRVVVNSEGEGAGWLRRRAAAEGLENLVVNPFQPFEQMSEVLAAADVLVAILEPDAGRFSVPSKVLTNLCAARPLLLAVPGENLAARIVAESGSGLVADPTDVVDFCARAEALYGDAELRRRSAQNALRYAESHFDIDRITDRFEAVLTDGSSDSKG